MGKIDPIAPALFPPDSVSAGFTDRSGGFSSRPYASLNLGGATADDPETVQRNRQLLYNHLQVPESSVALMGQVHGSSILRVDTGGLYAAVDGLLTDTPGILLGVLVADCVPLLLYDPEHRAAAAIHCGWRSITGGIVEHAVVRMHDLFGTVPERVRAATGPGAGVCCYEIGPEIAAKLHPSAAVRKNDCWHADLKAEIMSRLWDSEILESHMYINPDCTICNTRYFSHRREKGITGRMMGYILLK